MIKKLSGKKSGWLLKSTRIFSGLLILFLLIFSCKAIPFVSATKESSFKDYLFRTYQSGGSKFFSCDQIDLSLITKDKKNLKAKVYIHRGEFIYANVSFLGLELARAEITNDSVKFINRIEKSYLFDRFDALNNFFNVGLSYRQLESLIVNGIATERGESKRKFISHISDTADLFIFSQLNSQNIFINSYFDKNTFKETKIEIFNDTADFSVLALIDAGYDLGSYPASIMLNLKKGDLNVEVDIKVGKISYNKFDKRTFNVNNKYHKILF